MAAKTYQDLLSRYELLQRKHNQYVEEHKTISQREQQLQISINRMQGIMVSAKMLETV